MPVSITFTDLAGISGSLTFSTLDLARTTLDAIASCLPATAPDLPPVVDPAPKPERKIVRAKDMQPGDVACLAAGGSPLSFYHFRVHVGSDVIAFDDDDSSGVSASADSGLWETGADYTLLGRIDVTAVTDRDHESEVVEKVWPQVAALAAREGVSYPAED